MTTRTQLQPVKTWTPEKSHISIETNVGIGEFYRYTDDPRPRIWYFRSGAYQWTTVQPSIDHQWSYDGTTYELDPAAQQWYARVTRWVPDAQYGDW